VRRDELLDIAWELCRDDGFEAMSIDQLTPETRCSRPLRSVSAKRPSASSPPLRQPRRVPHRNASG
jgi:hypothetical protein